MLFSKFSNYSAPKVFKFIDPDTGHLYQAPDRKALITLIISYRAQNRLEPINDLHAVLDNYLCQLPEHCGACVPYEMHRSLFSYVKGGIALIKNLYYGDQNMVDQATADSRAEQCLKCPNNIFPDKSGFVKWSDDIAIASVGDRRSKHHDALGTCKACECPLRCKVFYGGTITLSQKEKEDIRAVMPNCWQLPPKG